MKFKQSSRNKVIRGKKKASYDKELIYGLLDRCEVCTVAFTIDGLAHVQPINFGRAGDKLYLHGHVKNRMTTALIEHGEVCLNTMYLDALKITRSAFNNSVQYRSVTVFGKVRELIPHEEKLVGLKAIVNHFMPDRWDHCREPNKKELNATRVLEIEIESAAAKIADTPPEDKEADYQTDYWSGLIPIKTIAENPIDDELLKQGIDTPQHILDFCDKYKDGF